jgi:hypothetical protein
MTKTLSRRLERLKGCLTPTRAPFEIEIEFISAVDGSVTKRLGLGGGANPKGHGCAGAPMATLPGKLSAAREDGARIGHSSRI